MFTFESLAEFYAKGAMLGNGAFIVYNHASRPNEDWRIPSHKSGPTPTDNASEWSWVVKR